MNSVCVWRLGASSGRLIRQIVLEDALLVAAGSVCAFVVGRAASGILVRWASNRNALFTFDLHPNLPLAALGVGLMLLSLLCFSILPAVIFLRTGVATTAGSRARVAGISQTVRQRLRSNVLLGTQVSLSLLLSTMSACFAATLVHWETVDVGMDREHVLIVRPELHQPRYTDHSEMLPELYTPDTGAPAGTSRRAQRSRRNVRRHSLRLDYGALRAWAQQSYGRAGAWAGRSCRPRLLFHARHSNSARTRFLFERYGQDAACGDHQPCIRSPIVWRCGPDWAMGWL